MFSKKNFFCVFDKVRIFGTDSNALVLSDIELNRFRFQLTCIDYDNGGLKEKAAQDVEGNILGFVFDDGRVKKFNKSGNLQQIIYPNGRVEYFHQDGRRYLTVHDNGEKEYRR